MFAIVFEVQPSAGKTQKYLDLAQHLKPMLEATDGFLTVERFDSRRRPGWMLSFSVWRDEKSVVRWRSQGEHHAIQLHGRADVFADYRLRVGEVTTDSDAAAPPTQQRLDATETGDAKALGVSEIPPDVAAGTDAADVARNIGLDLATDGLVDHDLFDSLYNPGKRLLLTSWRTAEDADRWSPAPIPGLRHRRLRSIRDYGLFDRREAPQFCPLVRRG